LSGYFTGCLSLLRIATETLCHINNLENGPQLALFSLSDEQARNVLSPESNQILLEGDERQ
jgi:hypothetical protein